MPLQHNELTGICSILLAMELIKSVCTKFATNLDKNIIHIFCLLVAILLFL